MTIEEMKQLDDLLIAEVNVKNIRRSILETDKGELVLNYNGETREYDLYLGGELQTRGKVLEEIVKRLIQSYENYGTRT